MAVAPPALAANPAATTGKGRRWADTAAVIFGHPGSQLTEPGGGQPDGAAEIDAVAGSRSPRVGRDHRRRSR